MKVYPIMLAALCFSLTCHSNSLLAIEPTDKIAPKTTFDSSANNLLIDMSGIQHDLAGGPVQVMVLGTAHLNGMKDIIPQEHLGLLLDKLASFSPDIIAIEGSNGISCGILKEYQVVYEQVWETYCWDPTYVLNSLKITPAQALKRAYQFLDFPESQITSKIRREMAAYFFAAGWSDSATLQWLQLPKDERKALNGVNKALKKWLDKRILSSNESVSIAAKLGAKLGLRYLHPMDDHTADIVYHNASKEMWEIIQSVWKNDSKEEIEYRKTEKELLGSPEGVLNYYRFLNSKVSQQLTIDADFGTVAKQKDKNNIARRYVSWWQARGLRMAAHVVEATARNPSAKVLVLVGSSHKAYFESYLNQMHDFKIVPVNSVIK